MVTVPPWTMRPSQFVVGLVLVLCLSTASTQQSECGESEVKCLCGVPRCVDRKLVNNGIRDCQDASDEQGQWDLGGCVERTKRGAVSELLRVTNGGATTTFFEGERGRTRPVGVLTTTMGSFQVSGTTTEYITKLIATYIKGTYARILTTTSRIYAALPTASLPEIKPTGFITSALSTEVNGYATTVHTTDFYRTYIDNTYAQQMSKYSNVIYPPWYTDSIEPSASSAESEETGKIYPTPVYIPIDDLMTLDSNPPLIQHNNNGRFGRILVNPGSEETPISSEEYPRSRDEFPRNSEEYPRNSKELPRSEEFPRRLDGMFGNSGQEVAPVSFRLNDNDVEVTGTHGEFVAGDKTYNVFTGTYLQGDQTFLFFFGNTALNPSSPTEDQQQTIVVENGRQRDHLVVDMRQNLKLIVPGTKERTTIDTTLDGQPVEGVMVEIEGSENRDDLITVEGATPNELPTPHDPRIAAVTVTMDRDIRKVSTSKSKVNVRVISENRSPVPENPPRPVFEKPRPLLLDQSTIQPEENEVPRGRAAKAFSAEMGRSEPESENRPQFNMNLPRYTVGQDGGESPRSYFEATTNSDEEMTVESTTAGVRGQDIKQRQPVFQKGTKATGPAKIQSPLQFSRKPKTFSDLRDFDASGRDREMESNDLMSAASNGHATVTYVGFADFTTTVGNTVIVFMPRTRMLEDLSIHASATKSVSVDPTRYTYLTTTEQDLPPVTTPKKPEVVPEIVTVPEIIEITTPKPPPVIPRPKFTKKKPESEIPRETTVLLSGRETLFSTLKPTTLATMFLEFPKPTPLFSPKVQFSSRSTELLETTPRLETAVFQKDKINPTGLVSSIGGSFVKDSTTTLVTSLVIGTYIDGSYAQVIKSTSTVFFQPSQTLEPTPLFIAPTPVPVLSSIIPTTQDPVFSYTFEVTTSNPEEETTPFERAEVRVTSSTTEVVTTTKEEEIATTTPKEPEILTTPREVEVVTTPKKAEVVTTPREPELVTTQKKPEVVTTPKEAETEAPVTTTTRGSSNSKEEDPTTTSLPINIQKEDLDEALNEIERARKVAGRPHEQIIVEDKKVDSTLEKPTTEKFKEEPTTTTPKVASVPEEVTEQTTPEAEQTIYVTKTVPTTVFRTYTYFTTYFIPKEDSTVSSIISREVTSTAVGFVKKTFSSVVPTATVQPKVEATTDSQLPVSYEDDEEENYTPTFYKTYFTTFTYLTTFFTGETSSVSSREEIISSVSTITQLSPSSAAVSAISQVKPTASPLESQPIALRNLDFKKQKESSAKLPSVIEHTVLKTFFTTYTYFSTLFNGAEASTRSRIEVITNVVPTVMRSTVSASIQPSSVSIQTAPSSVGSHSVEDLSEGGSSLSETSEPTSHQEPPDYYELESSEMPTDRSVYNEQELQEVDTSAEPTPALKTLFTTFSFFTTYYKGGTSSVATSLQTVTNIVSDGTETEEATDSDFPVFPITYLTTFTYWTTHFKGESTIVTSREETISNVVTPGMDDISPSTADVDSIQVKQTEEPLQREPKKMELQGAVQTEEPEMELTTYFTTYTYFTSSYIGDQTIVNSRLETVTNVVSGTPSATESPTPSSVENQARAVGSAVPDQDLVEMETLPVGLLSTVTNREVLDSTTTEYLTDVYGTYIDGIYAQVLESTSRVIKPTNIALTKFIPDETESITGLIGVNQGKTVDGDGGATTFYQTATIGSLIDGKYAQIISSSSSVSRISDAGTEDVQKTGLVRVIDGSLVQGDKTTFYTSSIYGTVIDNQYGQIIESTTRYVITPTEPLILPPVAETILAETILASSEKPLTSTENEETTTTTSTTTEGAAEVNPLRRLPGRAGIRPRVSVSAPTSKSFTPFITPFASRSRPTFTPKKKEATAAVIVSREEVTPTVTATLAPTSTRLPLQNRPRFRRPNAEDKENSAPSSAVPTPKLPTFAGRSRFQKPSAAINPVASTNPVASRNPVAPRQTPLRSVSISPSRPSSSARGISSRFSLRPRGSVAPARPSIVASSTAVVTTLPPPVEEEEQQQEVRQQQEEGTTEVPKTTTGATGNRFGNNRFRLNPKLNVQHLLSTTTTEKSTTPSRPRKNFTRPTLPTRAPPSTTEATEEDDEAEDEEQGNTNQAEQPTSTTVAPSTTTGKPSLKSLLANRKVVSGSRNSPPPSPNPRPLPQNRQLTTTPAPPPKTTTRRSFAPRARPQGFPSRALVRGPPTTEKSEEELNLDETKSVAERLEIPGDSALNSDHLAIDEPDEPDLVDSGSEFFETVRSPYDSYEVYSDEAVGSSLLHRRFTRQVEKSRSRAEILRTNFRRAVKSNFPLSSSDVDSRDADDDDYYYDDIPTTTTPKPTNSRAASRFRARLQSSISPSFASSRQTPFTLLPPQTTPRSVRPSSNAALLNSRRMTSRYRQESFTTNPPSTSRTTSRFKSSRNQNHKTTTSKPKSRFSAVRNRGVFEEQSIYYEKPTERAKTILTVTHFVPSETTVSVVNGKSTEFKTLFVPSPSVQVLSPYEYTNFIENGQEVRVLNSQVTSTPSVGFGGEVTRFIIKEVPTTTVTFTPTTIRGRKTSFSHVLSTHYYTIDPTVSTIGINMLTSSPGDNNQLTNLLLSQLLGSLNLAGLQQQQNMQMMNGNHGDPASAQTIFSTKTTTYVTTITDYTSTIVPLTLHGKPIKSTIVESQVNVLTATEFITESSVIPAATQTQIMPQLPALNLNPALLQGLLQQQLAQQQQKVQVEATRVEEREASSIPTLVTLFVSGKTPGEFSTVVSTITTVSEGRKRRDIEASKVKVQVVPTFFVGEVRGQVQLDDSYSHSEGNWIQTQIQNHLPLRTESLRF